MPNNEIVINEPRRSRWGIRAVPGANAKASKFRFRVYRLDGKKTPGYPKGFGDVAGHGVPCDAQGFVDRRWVLDGNYQPNFPEAEPLTGKLAKETLLYLQALVKLRGQEAARGGPYVSGYYAHPDATEHAAEWMGFSNENGELEYGLFNTKAQAQLYAETGLAAEDILSGKVDPETYHLDFNTETLLPHTAAPFGFPEELTKHGMVQTAQGLEYVDLPLMRRQLALMRFVTNYLRIAGVPKWMVDHLNALGDAVSDTALTPYWKWLHQHPNATELDDSFIAAAPDPYLRVVPPLPADE